MPDSIVTVIGLTFKINEGTTCRDLVYQHQTQVACGESFTSFLTWPDEDPHFWPEGEGCLGLVLIMATMEINRGITHELLSLTDPAVILKYCIDHKAVRLLQFLTHHLDPYFLKKNFSSLPAWATQIVVEETSHALADAVIAAPFPVFHL